LSDVRGIDRAPDAEKRIIQARALLSFLLQICHGDDACQPILKEELERVVFRLAGAIFIRSTARERR